MLGDRLREFFYEDGDGEMVELENILDSKIKKVRIELPHYSFSHSSSGESSHTSFVGRKQIKEKLKKIVEATTDKTGVYLVTGNRGVGKTSLVNKVINQTSLQPNSDFFKNLKYLFVLLFFVVGTQFCLQEFTEKFNISISFCSVFALSSFVMLYLFSGYRHKIPKQKICNFFITAIKELFFLISPYNLYKPAQYILKIILMVSLTQFFSIILSITPTVVFIGYSGIVLLIFVINKEREYYHKYKKGKLSKFFKILLFPTWNYLKNYRRLYLHINFGHKLKDEKDILRLVARTLNTEYRKYLRLPKRILPWRIMAFGFLLLLAYLFSTIVEKQEFYKPIKQSKLYRASSQVHLNDTIYSKDSTYLKVKDSVYIREDSI